MRRYDLNAGWGVVLIAVGLFFLADGILGLDLGRYGWPLIIVGIGGLLLLVGLTGLDPTRQSVTPGSIVTTVGLILLYQNTFDHYESWSYAWALIPASIGLGRALHARLTGGSGVVARQGLWMAGTFLIFFVVGLVFFEGILNISGRGSDALVDYALPLGLIVLGVWMLFGRARLRIV
jgi:hypothetical protein